MKAMQRLLPAITLLFMLIMSGCAGTPNEESTGEFFDSSIVTARVKAQLVDDPVTSGFRIKVSTFKGIVELSGTVYTEDEKQRAGMIAAGVEGVRQVKNLLSVEPPK